MTDKLSGLTDEQRKLLEKKLREKKRAMFQSSEGEIKHLEQESKCYSLSYNQESIWFVNRLYANNTIYNIGGVAYIDGFLNQEVFERSFQQLVKKHDILRTIFSDSNGKVVSKVLEEYQFNLNKVELPDDDKEIKAFIESEKNKPFDLENQPAYRVDVIKIREDRWMILLIIHHLLSDGASTQIIFGELIKNYEAGVAGLELPQSVQTINYGDYAIWQNKRRETLSPTYWENRLSNTDFKLDFFNKCTKLKQLQDTGVRIDFEVNEDVLKSITKLSKDKKTTVFSVLLGALYLTLYKYSGQTNLVSGVLTSGRDNAAVSGLIGCFVSAIPFEFRIDRESTIEAFIDGLYKQFLEDFKHKDELMVYENEELEHQILFSYEEDPENNIKVDGLDMSFEEVEATYCRSEIEIELNKLQGKIRGWLNYRQSLFDKAYMEQFVRHYIKVLSIITEKYETTIKDFEIVVGEERKRIVEDFNPAPSDYHRNATIPELFRNVVNENPGKIALLMGDNTMTYRELDMKSNQIAKTLISRGVTPGDKVALVGNRGFELICSIFGILKTGAAYVPIEADVPFERKNFMLKDSEAKFILVDRKEYSVTADDIKLETVLVEECFKNTTEEMVEVLGSPESMAYIIYTSGTTGIPKGVVVNHRNIIRTMENTNYLDSRKDDRLIALASYAFDGSVFEIFYPLLNGESLVLVSKDMVLDIPRLIDEIDKKDVNVMFITTALFNALIDVKPQGLKKMRRILFGGERASSAHVKKAIEVLGYGVVANIYGPTETTVFSTFCDITDKTFELESIPIGIPLTNSTALICNKDGNINPVGVEGEILIGGEGVTVGYLNRPDITKEKFIEYKDHNRYYKSGDIGKWTEDGLIIYCGRVDDQIKYRGFRIELGEIENAILLDANVEKTCVVYSNDEKNGAYLCGYIVTKESFSLDSLKRNLRKKLPSYMVPDYFVELKELPLNQNGKVDKKKLPLPESFFGREYVPPSNEQELLLVDIWKEVLGKELVGITDNFFELGGHSIKVAKACALYEEKVGAQLPLSVIFQHPTIKEICEFLSASELDGALHKTMQIEKLDDAQYYQASQSQKRMFFAQQMNKDNVSCNIPFAVKLHGKINIPQIEHAIDQMIVSHEILRTSFSMIDGEICQVVAEPFCYHLKKVLTDKTIERYFDDFIKPFDLCEGPLFRIEIVKTESGDRYLLGDFHHSIFDGTSMQVFLEDFSLLYNGQDIETPFLQYRDYASWNNNFLKSNVVAKQGDFWKEKYEITPNTKELPFDYQRPFFKTGKGEIVFFEIDKTLTDNLRKVSGKHGTTLNIVLMSIYHLLLRHYTGSNDIVVGTPVAGRRQATVQRMLGMFLNTVLVRSHPDSTKTVYSFIEEMKEEFLEDFENQDYPFDSLVEALKIPRSINRNPMFDTMFIMQNSVSWKMDFGETSFELCDMNYKTSKFDMQLEVYDEDEKLKCLVAYDNELFEASTIEMFIETYKKIASKVCENEDILLDDLLADDKEDMLLMASLADDLF